jgi:hypothetical protein
MSEWFTEINCYYVTEGEKQNLPKKFKIVTTYRHDNSLESSCSALSDDTISFKIQPFLWENAFSEFFSKQL